MTYIHVDLGIFEEDACTPAYMVAPHGCMEAVAACAGGEAVRQWAASLHAALDWGGYSRHI